MERSIIYVLYSSKSIYPVCLVKRIEDTQVVLEGLVLALSLAVRLGVVYGTQAPLDRKVLVEGSPEVARKEGATVGNDTAREAERAVDVVEEKIRKRTSSKRLPYSDIEGVLRKPIDYDQDSIVELISTGVN